jgi:hypothetical protein
LSSPSLLGSSQLGIWSVLLVREIDPKDSDVSCL